MKAFISQPMKDKTDAEILEVREKVSEHIKIMFGEDTEILDSFFQSAPHDAAPLWFLGESLKLMSKADLVVFCYGWEYTRGCRIEHKCAELYGIPYEEADKDGIFYSNYYG